MLKRPKSSTDLASIKENDKHTTLFHKTLHKYILKDGIFQNNL